jgi:hypothetical protein
MPSREDKIWIERKNVLTMLETEARSVGKSKRLNKMFQINRSDIERTEKNIQYDQIDDRLQLPWDNLH